MGFFSSFHSDRFSTHENQCGSCGRSEVSERRLDCYCSKYRQTYKLSEPKCSSYVKDRSRDYNFWKQIYTYHISTLICYVLKLENETVAFKVIKELREIMESDMKYQKQLAWYDLYGPEIASCILNDSNRVVICKELLVNYIVKVAILVKEGKIDEAISLYTEMLMNLYFKYKNQKEYEEIINYRNFQDNSIELEKTLVKRA